MKIFIWGAGFAARELLEGELRETAITAFIDKNKKKIDNYMAYSPEEAVNMEYDAVIVATGFAREIYKQANELGYDLSKFIFVYANYLFEDLNINYDLASRIFSKQYIDVMKNRYHVIRGMVIDEKEPVQFSWGGEKRHEDMYAEDYNRIRTFELIIEEIREKNVPGSVAELGVFKGEFAKYINEAFADRTCYLFDTFEGFRFSEAMEEKQAGNCGDAFIDRFKDTNENIVLSRMPVPEKIICKKGLFPESLDGLEDTFAFVSLDVDFEQAIYSGLEYFYPRLNKGGYIFVHDYNSATLKGVRNAVNRYENNNKIRIAKVPIPDLCGTLVITKGGEG